MSLFTDKKDPLYFWKPTEEVTGVFSQWFMKSFIGGDPFNILKDIFGEDISKFQDQTFICREQWMMALKALLFAKGEFKDINLQIFYKMMNSTSPRSIKQFGRDVKGFTVPQWCEWRYKIVVSGNYLQFSQDEDLKKSLLDTNNRYLAEASPYDQIWGVGYNEIDAKKNINDWPGKITRLNLLGLALMDVRDKLRK